jgi:hypothetical protein
MAMTGSPADWVSSACTLPTAEQPLRVAEFDRLFTTAVLDVRRLARTHLELTLDARAEPTARELAARESACCAFFAFTFGDPSDGCLVMTVTVPPQHVEILDALGERVQSVR